MRHHAWSTWAEIAIEQEAIAGAARGTDPMQELKPSLLAITSAAFALDALYAVGKDLGIRDAGAKARWKNVARVVQQGMTREHAPPDCRARIHDLLKRRDEAVHFGEKDAAPVPHPAMGGARVAVEHYKWRLEEANRAVDLVLEILSAWAEHPSAASKKWAEDYRRAVEGALQYRQDRRPP